jgi:hypothetical protein
LPKVLRAGGFATDDDLANEVFMKVFERYWSWFAEPERFEGVFDFGDEAFFK